MDANLFLAVVYVLRLVRLARPAIFKASALCAMEVQTHQARE